MRILLTTVILLSMGSVASAELHIFQGPQAPYQWTRTPERIIKHANTPNWGYRGYIGYRGYTGIVTGGDSPYYPYYHSR